MDSDATTRRAIYPDSEACDHEIAEDKIEESSPAYVDINQSDPDGNLIPGFADGFDKFGNEGSDKSVAFVRTILSTCRVDNPDAAIIRFNYSASDPDAVTRTDSNGPDDQPYVYQPGTGKMRIWTTDGPQSRNKASVASGGNFVPTDVDIIYSKFSWDGNNEVVLYIEGVDSSSIGAEAMISVTLDPDGPGGPLPETSDVVKVRFFPIEQQNAGNDSSVPP